MTASLPAYGLIPLPGEGPEDVVLGSDGGDKAVTNLTRCALVWAIRSRQFEDEKARR